MKEEVTNAWNSLPSKSLHKCKFIFLTKMTYIFKTESFNEFFSY